MQNDDLKRFYPQGGDSSDNNDFVRYDENGKIPYVDGKFLEKVTDATTNTQVYAKNPDGTQRMLEATNVRTNSAIVVRTGEAQVPVPDTPTADSHATSKKYVDDTFLAKQTGTTDYWQVYTKVGDGSQQMTNCSDNTVLPTSIVVRNASAQIVCADPTANNQAATKGYVDTKIPAAPSEVGTYVLKAVVTESGTTYSWVAES